MRVLLISDIHGNLPALEKVVEETKGKYDEVWCLGDVVGYGANPNECCEWVKENVRYTVLGNHEAACFEEKELENFNEYAKEAVRWSKKQLKEENLKFLSSLPYTRTSGEDFLLVHSSPSAPEEWIYVLSLYEGKKEFNYFEEWICFFGHTHIPLILERSKNGECKIIEPSYNQGSFNLSLNKGKRYLVNVGSIGQPRDSDWRASYVLFDTEKKKLIFNRTPYDVERAKRDIYQKGLPRFLGDRLIEGR